MRLKGVVSKHKGGRENAYVYREKRATGSGSGVWSERPCTVSKAENERRESRAAETGRWVATLIHVVSLGHREQRQGASREQHDQRGVRTSSWIHR